MFSIFLCMKLCIYYYSLTGNTLLGCKYIASKLNVDSVVYHNILNKETPNPNDFDLVGFACFTDNWQPPELFCSYIDTLPQIQGTAAFIFNTYGCISGKTLSTLTKHLGDKGFTVHIGHSLHTPENYPPMIKMGLGFKNAPNVKELLAFNGFIDSLNDIIIDIEERCPAIPFKLKVIDKLVPKKVPAFLDNQMRAKSVHENLCNQCGVCEKGCPVQAITLNETTPTFAEELCHKCWSCYNKCSKKAIYTKGFDGIAHYPRAHSGLKQKLRV